MWLYFLIENWHVLFYLWKSDYSGSLLRVVLLIPVSDTSLNQSTNPFNNMILFLWCSGLGFGHNQMKDVCLVTQVFLIRTLECSTTTGAAFSWPSSAIRPWRITCLWSLGQINPHHAHLISRDPGVRHGMCKPEVLVLQFYLAVIALGIGPGDDFHNKKNTV